MFSTDDEQHVTWFEFLQALGVSCEGGQAEPERQADATVKKDNRIIVQTLALLSVFLQCSNVNEKSRYWVTE
jgi:hypothetical protein